MPFTAEYLNASFGSSRTGIGTVGYTLMKDDGTVSVGRTTTGVVEEGGGVYGVADVTIPDDAYSILWDTGGGSPLYAAEDLEPMRLREITEAVVILALDATVSSRAVPGDEMALVDDAITAAKHDETTAFPVKSADSGASQIARTGADGDTLETLSDQIDGVAVPGSAMNLTAGAVDDIWDEVLTGATHNIQNSAGKRLRQIQEELGYEGGAVYIDTVNGTPGTNPFENGTVGLPSSNLPDALTIAAAVGLRRFIVYPGSSLTLAASFDSYVIQGTLWTLALGGQSISGSYIEGATISGIGTGATPPKLVRCSIGTATLPPCFMRMCDFAMGITAGGAGDYFFDQCFSAVAGVSTPYFDFAAAGANDVNFRHYSGGIEIRNMSAGDRMSLEGHGQYILAASCSGGILACRGAFNRTDNAGGAVTESINARLSLSGIRAEIMTYVLEANPLGMTFEESVQFIRKAARNDLRQTDGDTDNLILLDDDGATPFFKWDSKNKNGGNISQPTAAPARRIPS